MTDLVPFEYSEDRSYDEQMREALEKALSAHGTVINDLQSAMNCILQMERALAMVYAPNPVQAEVARLKAAYNMYIRDARRRKTESMKLLNSPRTEDERQQAICGYLGCDGCEMCGRTLELMEGEVVDEG